MFVAYCTMKASSPRDFYKNDFGIAAFGFLMALSALCERLPFPSLPSFQDSRSFWLHIKLAVAVATSKPSSGQQPQKATLKAAGGRRREGQRWAKQDDGLSLVSTHHHLPPLYTTSDFNAILGGGRRWWYGLRGCRRVSGSRPRSGSVGDAWFDLPQRPRTDLNERSLPRPKTTAAWKLMPHRSKISKNWNPPQWVPIYRFFKN